MSITMKPLQELTETDLISLVTNEEVECKTLEYKVTLPGKNDEDKKEFLADISSFANAVGGLIIYGMAEENGKPINLSGVDCDDPDAEILRLENSIRDGVEPRIQGVGSRYIRLGNGKYAFVISIPQSWQSPHMVTFKNHSRFFSRQSNGKFQLDVQEIRQAVLTSDNLSSRIRNFHLDRLSKVIAGETPVLLSKGAKIVMHLIPIVSLQANINIDLKDAGSKYLNLGTLNGSPINYRYNLDGLVTWVTNQPDVPCSYTQLFRNGIIEAVDNYILREREGETRIIRSTFFEKAIKNTFEQLIGFQTQVGITPPFYIFVSLAGVKGYTLVIRPGLKLQCMGQEQKNPVDRDILFLPEISLETYDGINSAKLFRNVFDAVWNATGWPECRDYDSNGNLIEN